jgi:hypothetical protein
MKVTNLPHISVEMKVIRFFRWNPNHPPIARHIRVTDVLLLRLFSVAQEWKSKELEQCGGIANFDTV